MDTSKFNFLLDIKKNIDICSVLEISNYELNKLKEKVRLNYNLNSYEEGLIQRLFDSYPLELSDYYKFQEKSLNERITNLSKILVKYYKKVDVARFVNISDTHLNRIINGLDKVKYSYEIYQSLLSLYNQTLILPYDILKDEVYNYSPNKENERCDNSNEKIDEAVNFILNDDLDIDDMKKEIISMIKELNNSGLKYTSIAKKLKVSNSLVHVTLRGNFPKNESKVMKLYFKLKNIMS